MNDVDNTSFSNESDDSFNDFLDSLIEKAEAELNNSSNKMLEDADSFSIPFDNNLDQIFDDLFNNRNLSNSDVLMPFHDLGDTYYSDWKDLCDFYNKSHNFYSNIMRDYTKATDCLTAIDEINIKVSWNSPVTDEFINDDLLLPVGGAAEVKRQLTSSFGGKSYGGGLSYPGDDSTFGSTRNLYNPGNSPFGIDVVDIKYDDQVNRSDESQNSKNPYNFNFSELSEEEKLEQFINAGLPVFLHGKSGCGKSARIKEIDPDCIILYLAATKPDMLVGKTIVVDGETMDIPPDWYKTICKKSEQEPDKNHVLFFDEITNATPAIQGMAYNIILDKVVNGKWKLPDNVKVVAAGNEDKESLSANKISEPLFRRFNHLYIETTLESWLLWASKHNIHPAIYAFVASKGDGREQVLRTECNGKDPCVDPRKWEMASKLLYKCRNPRALTATIGERLTEEFIRFCKMPVITLDQVIHGEYDENMPRLSIDEGYATLIGLAACNENDIEVVRKFVKKYVIPDQYQNFVRMWTRGDQERIDKIRELDMLEKIEEKGNVR